MGEEEQMNSTPNAERPMPNVERSEHSTLGVECSALDVWRFLWRILDFVVAGIFIYAGALKAIDPVQFASDIDNYKLLPWPVIVPSRFIFRGWKFCVRSRLYFVFYIVAPCRF